jgi:hypothetical protein
MRTTRGSMNSYLILKRAILNFRYDKSPLPAALVRRDCASSAATATIHPNNREAVAGSDCLWQSCTERTRCHISLAVSHQRRRHSLIPLHCLQLNQYQRQLPRPCPHVPPLIQVLHLPERRVRCQRRRYQLQRHSPLGRGIGTLSPAERKFGSTGRLLGRTHKTCASRALPRTMERPGRYRRIPHTAAGVAE